MDANEIRLDTGTELASIKMTMEHTLTWSYWTKNAGGGPSALTCRLTSFSMVGVLV